MNKLRSGSRKFTQIPFIWWKDCENRSSRFWDRLAHIKKEEITASKIYSPVGKCAKRAKKWQSLVYCWLNNGGCWQVLSTIHRSSSPVSHTQCSAFNVTPWSWSSHSQVVTRLSRHRLTRHKWAHNKAISCQRGSAHCPVKTVLNTDDIITKTSRQRNMGGECWKLMTNKEMTVKLLEKYLVWKNTKWIIMDHMYAVSILNLQGLKRQSVTGLTLR